VLDGEVAVPVVHVGDHDAAGDGAQGVERNEPAGRPIRLVRLQLAEARKALTQSLFNPTPQGRGRACTAATTACQPNVNHALKRLRHELEKEKVVGAGGR